MVKWFFPFCEEAKSCQILLDLIIWASVGKKNWQFTFLKRAETVLALLGPWNFSRDCPKAIKGLNWLPRLFVCLFDTSGYFSPLVSSFFWGFSTFSSFLVFSIFLGFSYFSGFSLWISINNNINTFTFLSDPQFRRVTWNDVIKYGCKTGLLKYNSHAWQSWVNQWDSTQILDYILSTVLYQFGKISLLQSKSGYITSHGSQP